MLSEQLLSGVDLGPPQPYIPTFYQFCGQIRECPAAEVGELRMYVHTHTFHAD